jgi:DNA-binding CsgD family transcriptional regulator
MRGARGFATTTCSPTCCSWNCGVPSPTSWLSLTLDGQQDTAHELLAGFPAGVAGGDPELIALAAADELNRGSFEEAEGHLARATRELASVPAERRGRFQVTLGILAGTSSLGAGSSAAPPGEPRSLLEPLSQAETRILRYLPTNLTVPEIASQLHLSVNTVRTHMRHLYKKLGTHRRHEAVERARALGLLARATQRP